MNANEELIERFYKAFQKRDAAAMVACYHDDITFSDPVFQNLKGEQAKNMWRMLAERAKDLQLTYSDVQANEWTGKGYWEAIYIFSATGNKVHNKIHSSFKFKDGKIIEHRDSFDLRKWAGMALGLKGKLLGWLPPVQNTIRRNAMQGLEAYTQKAKSR